MSQKNLVQAQPNQELTQRILDSSIDGLAALGAEVSPMLSAHTVSMLQESSSEALGEAEKHLTRVLGFTRGVNQSAPYAGEKGVLAAVQRGTRKIPVLGALVRKVTPHILSVKDATAPVGQNLDVLEQELNLNSEKLSRINENLSEMRETLRNQYRVIEVLVASSYDAIEKRRESIKTRKTSNHPLVVQELREEQEWIEALEVRAAEYRSWLAYASQQMGRISGILAANRGMQQKLRSQVELNIPVWRDAFAIRGALIPQKKVAEVIRAIEEGTDLLLMENAQIAHDTLVQTTESLQRLSINPETLDKTGKLLAQSVDAVSKIKSQRGQALENDLRKLEAVRAKAGSGVIRISQGKPGIVVGGSLDGLNLLDK